MLSLLYRDEGGLSSRLLYGDKAIQTLATADPPVHTAHKRIVFPEFVAKRMALLEPEIADVASECVERALAAQDVDFMAMIGNIVPITMISRLIDFRNSDVDRLLQAAFDSTALLGATLSRERLMELVTRSSDVGLGMAGQLTSAMNEPGEDILGSIADGVRTGALDPRAGVIILHALLSAGGESTTSLLGSAVRILADH
jgi:cytochrome P450